MSLVNFSIRFCLFSVFTSSIFIPSIWKSRFLLFEPQNEIGINSKFSFEII